MRRLLVALCALGVLLSAAAPAQAVAAAPTCSAVAVSGTAPDAVNVTLTCTGSGLLFALVGTPGHGSYSGFNSVNGTVIYTPDPGYFGTDTFMYQANDGVLDSETAMVSITVAPPPVPLCDAVNGSTAANTAVTQTASCTTSVGFPVGYTLAQRRSTAAWCRRAAASPTPRAPASAEPTPSPTSARTAEGTRSRRRSR